MLILCLIWFMKVVNHQKWLNLVTAILIDNVFIPLVGLATFS